MATVEKDFKIKKGLIVEGTTGTINNHDILTKKTDDQNYIIGLIGGSSDSANTPNTVVKRDGSGDFAAGVITADIVGDVTGQVSDISNHDTNDLSEGSTNKYFTNQRAIDANTGLWDTAGSAANAQNAAETYADGLISTEVTNRNNAISSAISTEVTNRNNAIDSAISQEVSDRDSAISTAITNLNLAGTYDALGAAADVQDNLDAHTGSSSAHGVTGDIVGTTDAQTISNKTLGSDLAAGGYKVSGLATPTNNADAATKSYVDTAVANLVDSAPALLDTLNELAAAIGDDQDFIGTVTASIGEKVAKSGDSMSGNLDFGGTNKVTSLATPTSNGDAANKLYVDNAASTAESNANSYTDTEISALDTAAQGYASTAQSNAESFATNADSALYTTVTGDIATAKSQAESTAQGYANTAETNAENYASGLDSATNTRIDNLDTDDVAEGSNLYYTAARAKAEAATLLANATKTNIIITKDGSDNLTITAENGVADSDTDDLTEGTTNLYFTDARAVSALEAVTPQFQAVDITWATKNTATYTYVANASVATAMSWSTNYASAKFLVRVRSGNHSQVSEVLVTADNSNNVAITEYAIVGTNGNLGNVSANFSGGQYNLTVETTENNSEVIVYATLMAYGD